MEDSCRSPQRSSTLDRTGRRCDDPVTLGCEPNFQCYPYPASRSRVAMRTGRRSRDRPRMGASGVDHNTAEGRHRPRLWTSTRQRCAGDRHVHCSRYSRRSGSVDPCITDRRGEALRHEEPEKDRVVRRHHASSAPRVQAPPGTPRKIVVNFRLVHRHPFAAVATLKILFVSVAVQSEWGSDDLASARRGLGTSNLRGRWRSRESPCSPW
jgi:hypothetical protein